VNLAEITGERITGLAGDSSIVTRTSAAGRSKNNCWKA